MKKKIVLFVEGEGDAVAVPLLVKKILTEQEAWDSVYLDEETFRVGQINKLIKGDYLNWKRYLKASLKRPNLGGVLLLIDGDIKKVAKAHFCAAALSKSLSKVAREVGGGSTFSVACVFAMQEYESWLIAGIEHLAGKTLPNGSSIPENTSSPDGNLEESPRDAKGWLRKSIRGGY